MLALPMGLYLHPGAQLLQGTHVAVYQSDCCYVPYLIHFWVLCQFVFTRTDKTQDNTQSMPFSYELSSYKAPTWWFIDLTVAMCHI